MTELQLQHPKASYLHETNDGIQIRSPITLTQQIKGPIGIHLQGFQKPKTRMILKFHPQANVSAVKLLWTLDGAVLHLTVKQGQSLTSGQILGKLTSHTYSQQGLLTTQAQKTKFSSR